MLYATPILAWKPPYDKLAITVACEDRRSQIPGVWSAVDEPIRRYLLYGEESAEQFLINSVALYLHYTGRRGHKEISVDLPERVLNAFDAWYQQPRQEPMPRSGGEPREQSDPDTTDPLIYYDPIAQEIMVRAPTYSDRHWDANNRAELELTGTETRRQQQIIPLRIYRRPDGLVETETREFPLPFPAERYDLRLKSRGLVVREWKWTGTDDRQHFIFDGASGHLLPGHELPRERAYLIINTSFRVEPESCVLETAPLYGPWRIFTVHTLNPADLDRVTLVDKLEPGQSYSIPVASEALPVLEPLGGHLLEGITRDGQPVYAVAPEEIRIPLRSKAELRLWHLSLTQHTDQPRKTIHMRVSELEASGAVRLVNDCASIRLSHRVLLGSGAAGDFVVRLRRPPFRDWRSTFTLLPGLAVQFDPAVYAPYAPGEAPSAKAAINLPDVGSLSVSPPARLVQSDGPHHYVQASLRDDFVRVVVRLGDRDLPLTIALPKTYWRLQGLADPSAALWRDQIEEDERWLDDWQGLTELFLVAELPPSVSGFLILSLDGVMPRTDRQPLRRGKARFNLLAFRDALRSGSALRELKLSLEQGHLAFPPVSLLKVRWHWEVAAVECLQESKGHKTLLTVTWQERGKTEGHSRVVRLWRSGYPMERPVAERIVDQDAYRVQLEIESSQAPPGEYLLHFALLDPWASSLPKHPEPGTTNCHTIVIVRKEEICEGCLIGIRAVRLSPGSRVAPSEPLVPGLYQIRIVGRIINKELPPVPNTDGVLVTRLNEGWYVGNMEVQPGSGLDGEVQAANPVKFEYDVATQEITAIEDRGGDGAMYCRQCRRLFWSQEMLLSEQRRKHPLFGPVEHFEVAWL